MTDVSKLDRYISKLNYKEAYHSCGFNNLINPIKYFHPFLMVLVC